MSPDEIFRSEADEALEKITEALNVCRNFRRLYDQKKATLTDYYADLPDKEVRSWDFESKLIFTRFDLFVGRLATLEVPGRRERRFVILSYFFVGVLQYGHGIREIGESGLFRNQSFKSSRRGSAGVC